MNTQQRARSTIDPRLRQELEADFAPEIGRLEALIGRDLVGWTSASQSGS
jgi:hypothetical protein